MCSFLYNKSDKFNVSGVINNRVRIVFKWKQNKNEIARE